MVYKTTHTRIRAKTYIGAYPAMANSGPLSADPSEIPPRKTSSRRQNLEVRLDGFVTSATWANAPIMRTERPPVKSCVFKAF